ncbi:hypothetical protein HK405_006995 [Cladochytrium tenue]|nr:hypothetical protein HK405_006995 [Cladochytrium tenue]
MSSRAKPYTIVPILVGSISNAKEALYGNLLAPYLLRKNVFFIISSDFCHWGSRFRHTPKSPPTPVHEHIEAVDRAGMRLIEALDTAGFADYLRSTKNTICGRHPIAVFLHAIATARDELSARGAAPPDPDFFLRFVHYEQSSRALSDRDSSVSYASAVCRAPPA